MLIAFISWIAFTFRFKNVKINIKLIFIMFRDKKGLFSPSSFNSSVFDLDACLTIRFSMRGFGVSKEKSKTCDSNKVLRRN